MHNARARIALGLTAVMFSVMASTAGRSFGQACEPVGPCGDVDATGSVNTSDALKVLRTAVGQPQDLTCECSGGGGTCEDDLATCTGELDTCTADLSDCTSDLIFCDDDLGSCETKLDECLVDLSSTNADLAACLAEPSCGNGDIEDGEDCEKGVLLIASCSSLGFAGGNLRCGTACEWDTTGCYETRFELTSLTIRDHETGLEWERKNGANGSTDLGNPHDVDNVYFWSDPGIIVTSTRGISSTAPDGSAFVYFLGALNGAKDGEGFAGHTDWRMPTADELSSITALDPDCESSPCVAAKAFLPNRAAPYWTITTGDLMATGFAMTIDYDDGTTASSLKTNSAHVRAVRTRGDADD